MNSNFVSRTVRLSVLVLFVLANLLLAEGEAYAIGGSFGWAKNIGGTEGEGVNGLAVDAAGNIYMTGGFSGTVDFDPGPGTFNLTESRAIYILKLDDNGNLIWVRSVSGPGSEDIAVDSAGNVYTTGTFEHTVDFDPGPGTFNLTSEGFDFDITSRDIFVSKLDSNGDFVWAKRMGGPDFDWSESLTVDAGGNVYTTGSFRSIANFGGVALVSAGLSDIFIAKLNSNGNLAWARRFGGVNNDPNIGLAVDAGGNVYTTGGFQETIDFDPGPGTANLTSAGGSDIFLSRLDSNGNFVWVKQMSGANGERGSDIAVDPAGGVYTTGGFAGTVDFDPGAGTYNLTSTGQAAIFFSKLDSSGNFLWARSTGGVGRGVGGHLTLDTTGNLYTTGYFYDTVDFDPGSGTANLTSNGALDIYVAKLDRDGNYAWARQLGGGGNAEDNSKGIAVDPSGNVYVTGGFMETVDFDPGPGTNNLTSTGVFDIFLLKLQEAAIFGDIPPGYWALDFIERLYMAGITGGCATSPLRYCPEDTVTRAQMAVFLLKGIHTAGYVPPDVAGATGFGDVPTDYWAAAFIKQLAVEGITSGCGGGNYCPEQPVTRAQMAVFLLKAKYGAGYVPPAVGSGTGFGDVPANYWAAAFIKQLVTEGITAGCGGGNYCPEQPVTRAQMAVFLVRTFGLP